MSKFTFLKRFTTKLEPLLLLSILSLLSGGWGSKLFAQGGSIHGQVVQPLPPVGSGGPAANAPILVCPSTATGTPCSPTLTVYSDPALTQVVSSPATDANGNFSYFVTPGYVIVQITPLSGTVYSYLVFAGVGTVSSVSLLMPNIFSINSGSGCTITSSGTCNVTLVSQSGNLVWASPNGVSGLPTFRNVVGADFNSQSAYNVLANCTASSTTPTFCPLNANMIPSTLNGTIFNGNVSVTGTLGVTGNTSLSNLSLSGTLGVTGASTLSSLGVTGNTTVGGTLGVTGNTSASTMSLSGLLSANAITSTSTIKGVRYYGNQGTALSSSNFLLSGFGTGASVFNINGYDPEFTFFVNSGTGPSANPSVQVTFANGGWSAGGTGVICVANPPPWYITGYGNTVIDVVYSGTPAGSTNYVVNVICQGF